MSLAFRIGAKIGAYPKTAAFVAGLLSACGFAPIGIWPITLFMLAFLIWLITRSETRKSAFGLGWAFGLGHFALGLNWIATAFTFQAKMPSWIGWAAVIGLSAYLAIYPALATLGAWMIGQKSWKADRNWPLILGFAGCWIITEWLRSWVMTGFAWNPLSAIVIFGENGAPMIANWLLPWVGTYVLSGFVVLFSGQFASLANKMPATDIGNEKELQRKELRMQILWGVAIAAFAVMVVFRIPLLFEHHSANGYNKSTPITIIQPNVSQADKWEGDAAAANFAKLAMPTRLATRERLIAPKPSNISSSRKDFIPSPDTPVMPEPVPAPRLIFWPEAAIPDYLETGYPLEYYRTGPALARARLASLLGPDDRLVLGALKLEFDKDAREPIAARNSVMIVDALGKLAPVRYDKSHLVPGGEYLPMRSLLSPLGLDRLAPGDLEFWPGPGPRTISLDTPRDPVTTQVPAPLFPRMGVQICYEIIFSGQVVDRKNRPDFIFNPSNDAWFGSWGPPQHLAQARMRAIEEGLPVIRSTPTGISAVIDAQGRVVQSIGMGKAGRIDTTLPPAHRPSLFSALGNAIPASLSIILIFFAIALARRTR